jgi:hypothetical protein
MTTSFQIIIVHDSSTVLPSNAPLFKYGQRHEVTHQNERKRMLAIKELEQSVEH